MKEDQELEVEVQFQLNRLPVCEMHLAIDKLPEVDLVYPDVNEKVVIPWTPGKQWWDIFIRVADESGKVNWGNLSFGS